MKRFVMAATVLLSLAVGLIFSAPMTVLAGADLGNDGIDTDCPPTSNDFVSVGAAQAYFEGDGGSVDRNVDDLDSDGDGLACEDSVFPSPDPSGGPPVVDPVSCGFFDTQADAQAALDAGQGDPAVLDPDGDGFACEFRFGEVVTPPSEGGAEPPPPGEGEAVIVAYPVTAYLCDTDPGDYNPNRGDVLGGGCVLADGITFSVAQSSDGTVYGSCTTIAGRCTVDAPQSLTDPLVITEDVSTVPAGYAPRANPLTDINFSEFAGAIFFNIRTGGTPASEAPKPSTGGTTTEPSTPATRTGGTTTTSLPSTGSGPNAPGSLPAAALLCALFAGAALVTGTTRVIRGRQG